jgi:CheY-like chemotaxis protein
LVTGRKLLLADDSVTIQKVVDLTFTDEGLEVVTVGDGQQALEKLEEFTPDIVLADVFMPKVSGYELCERVKRDERFRHIPVMLLVGSFEPFDEAEARRVGADDYLTKPFQSIRTLIGKVRNLLTGGNAESDSATTRQLAPPPEAGKVKRPDSDFLELSTADTAPLPEANQEDERAGVSHKVPFTDLSMDDEMIEATPASDYSHTGQLAQTRMTAQYSAADLKEAGIAQAVESAPAPEVTVGALAATQTGEPTHAAASPSQPAPRASAIAASDDSLLDLGDIEPPAALAEADDFFLDLLDETPTPTQSHISARAETSAPFVETAQSPQAQEFVEAQVIEEVGAEFAPVEATPVVESEPTREPQQQTQRESFVDAQTAPTQRLRDNYQGAGATSVSPAAESTHEAAPESAAPRTDQITLEQLSPEVIDAIARRAVEQLSERVVEQIAWEVVPQLAELLIKRRLEEKK